MYWFRFYRLLMKYFIPPLPPIPYTLQPQTTQQTQSYQTTPTLTPTQQFMFPMIPPPIPMRPEDELEFLENYREFLNELKKDVEDEIKWVEERIKQLRNLLGKS